MLKLENVSKIYYDEGMIATGFSKLNLELKLGEFVVITGESGSGKSTLLNVISGLDTYEEGEMYINGKETSHYTTSDFEEYRKKYIANIFQNFNLVNSYTVYQNVELILLLNGYKKRHIKQKVLSIIEEVGLSKFKNTKVSKLSGGQKQRVAIARAIIKDTPIIVADEPTGNLDSKSAKEVIEILKKVAKGKLVVIVTHNIEQVEEYATRIIKMHDGRIVQNTEVKKIKEKSVEKIEKYNNIKILNQYRLGIRNTFNIFSKFVLLFFVFFFMGAAFLAEYAGFELMKENNEQLNYGLAIGFDDLSSERILIKKQDKTPFTADDYANIKSLSNVDYIVEDDLFLDQKYSLSRDDLGLQGNMLNIETLKGDIELGRTIENSNEMVLKISRKHFYITNRLNDVLNKTFSIMDSKDNTSIMDLDIVGIQFTEDDNDYNPKFYVSNEVLNNLRSLVNKSYSTVQILLNNQYGNYSIAPNENVKQGYAIVNDELKYLFKYNRIKNELVTITVKNIYYEEMANVKVSGTYTKSNFKRVTGLENYEGYRNTIFINPADYYSFYDKPSYQSSVFVKDNETIEETISELETLGLNAKKITDYITDAAAANNHIVEITRVVVTIIIIVVLFLLSYVIIRLIMKSRNIYYTTLRMLGATYKNVRKILHIELLFNASLAYITILVLIYFINTNIINNIFLKQLTSLISIREYIITYIILFVILTLVSRKFAKHIFKKSAISTYQEEV